MRISISISSNIVRKSNAIRQTVADVTTMLVVLIVGPKYMLAASHAAP